jgi:hypothetical protein
LRKTPEKKSEWGARVKKWGARVKKWRRNAEKPKWQLHKQKRNEGRRVDFTSEGFTAARAKRVESIGTEITMLQLT